MKQQAHIYVRGLVQGVGFRPFIYIIANSHKLKGYVLNLGDAGVEILVEGEENEIKSFIEDIRSKKPLISRIDTIDVQFRSASNKFNNFEIAKSDDKHLTIKSVIPTDISICDICITDIKMKSRWNNYPFTSCAQCGPRFTMISKLPYDRSNTSMADFPFCPQCETEYYNPLDRRYDAQGITCPVCGPTLRLLDNQNNKIDGNPILETAKLINEGNIIAIKGIGGFHIAADATNEEVVTKLRKRRMRPSQPFAVMSDSISKIEKYAMMSFKEKTLLTNPFHPIVTLTKSETYSLASSVSPNLNSIGVMLPYTGIHLLLLDRIDKDATIMTSGNYPHKPIYIDNNEAKRGLNKIVDYYLVHNRQIINRCDDSVIKNIDDTPFFLRKSRGYAPSSITIPWSVSSNSIISVGGEYNTTGSILMENRIVTTQHIGDVNEVETLDFLKNALNFIKSIYNIQEMKKIAHDLNPSFLTTRYAHELAELYKAEVVPVQHHHAHMASLMADNNMPKETSIVCIAIDGVGYGTDRMAWGGEILYGGYSHFERVGQLRYQPMPGGDASTTYPARMLGSILTTILDNTEINRLFEQKYIKYLKYGRDELDIILKQSRSSNVLKTSSMGRLLDSIATLLEICTLRTYEGEPPMCLEAFALKGNPDNVTLRLPISQRNGIFIFDTSEFIISIMEALDCCRKEDIAYQVHRTLGRALAKVACKLCDKKGISDIGLVGGSAVNSLLFNHIKKEIILNNKNFVCYKTIPPGDGGISIGQAIIASVSENVT